MKFTAYDSSGQIIDSHQYYSIGGGEIRDDNGLINEGTDITSYPYNTFREILDIAQSKGVQLWELLN